MFYLKITGLTPETFPKNMLCKSPTKEDQRKLMTFEELERLYRTDQKRWECAPYLKNEVDGPKSGYFGINVRVFSGV